MGDSALFTHPDYKSQDSGEWTHFDDRSFADEWQDEVYDHAYQIFESRNFSKVIDFGCGSGFKLVKYFPPAVTIGVELEPSLSYLRWKYPLRTWRSSENFDDNLSGGDMVICSDVIEHLTDPSALLTTFARSACEVFVISTPAVELMADRGISPRLGPPSNKSHIREWSTGEFRNFVSHFLQVIDQKITNIDQCTQMVVAVKK